MHRFSSFDATGNGFLNLAEVDGGLRNYFGVEGDKLADALTPAITRAFHAAKDAVGEKGKAAKYIIAGEEFRLLLVYLKRYFELLFMFDEVDTSNDRRIDLDEFTKGVPLFATWGVIVVDPAAEFAELDTDGGGRVLFDEFSGWALKRGLDMDTSDTVSGETELRDHHKLSSDVAEQEARELAAKRRQEAAAAGGREFGTGDLLEKLDLRTVIDKLPVCENRTEEFNAKERARLFKSWDLNSNGFLTFAELHRGLTTMLGSMGEQAVDALSPAITRAFHAARDARTVGKASEYVAEGCAT